MVGNRRIKIISPFAKSPKAGVVQSGAAKKRFVLNRQAVLRGEGGICELCGAQSTTSYEFDMFLITHSTRESLVSKRLNYRTERERVECCNSCHSSLVRFDRYLGVAFVMLWFPSSVVALCYSGFDGVLSFFFGVFWSFFACFWIVGLLMFPFFYLFSAERRIARKIKRISDMMAYGWQFGRKPSNDDYHWKDYHNI